MLRVVRLFPNPVAPVITPYRFTRQSGVLRLGTTRTAPYWDPAHRAVLSLTNGAFTNVINDIRAGRAVGQA